ncbi:DsbA family protein [Kiloniella laminariae]|uniref:DsbA family protein n=1 Tax=Kiloniella laminariae TaxID=454162 RepID=A0ABT4LEB2_9PROT|nr:DsbA family protein [Kiloniella laminariae]MCZ4279429.1 DsbA family protein [Kiloniella laminariae]
MNHHSKFFKLPLLASGLLLATLSYTPPLLAENAPPTTESATVEQTQAFEEAVRKYLLENPEVIIESLTRYQQLQAQRESELKDLAISMNADQLHNDQTSPVLGNPDGDVVLVEFFDYRCPYCHKASKIIQALIEDDPNLKVVMKEFPILGPESVVAARAALAAQKQGKYAEYHFALMENAKDLSQNRLLELAADLGLDKQQFAADMKSAEIGETILKNRSLAEKVGAEGTPAFIVGTRSLSPGTSYEAFQQVIADIRSKGNS